MQLGIVKYMKRCFIAKLSPCPKLTKPYNHFKIYQCLLIRLQQKHVQPLMDFGYGVMDKIYLFWGACSAPKVWWASPLNLWLWNFDNHPISKITILRREKIVSSERHLKMVKFAKNDHLDVLIVLARDEQFLLPPWKWSKGGTIRLFFSIFSLDLEKKFYKKKID